MCDLISKIKKKIIFTNHIYCIDMDYAQWYIRIFFYFVLKNFKQSILKSKIEKCL